MNKLKDTGPIFKIISPIESYIISDIEYIFGYILL